MSTVSTKGCMVGIINLHVATLYTLLPFGTRNARTTFPLQGNMVLGEKDTVGLSG